MNALSEMRRELECLLGEELGDCVDRERSAFDRDAGPARDSIVLFGAGRLGRRTAQALRAVGRPAAGFADNNQSLWGTTVEGLTVLSPADAVSQFGRHSCFVVTIWRAGGSHRFAHSREQLRELGGRHVIPISPLAWKHPSAMLPHYCLDLPHRVLAESEEVRKGFDLLCDDRSRIEFLSQLRFRLLGDFDGLAHPDSEPQYLATDLFRWREDEVFVDGGAFDGDTLRSVIAAGKSFERYIALEPDSTNYHALKHYLATLPAGVRSRVEVSPVAAYSTRARMRLDGAGSASAVLVEAEGGGIRDGDVECVPLDEYLAERAITFVKLDIEGAEPNALQGARHLIARNRPVLAVCVYHSQNHLWRLPLLIDSVVEDYRYYLRPYNEEAWDLVCYAVPIERALHEGTRS